MTKTGKSICFFLALISLACGVIYAGQRHAEKAEIDWLVVGFFVAVASFVFLLSVILPDIVGPAQGLGLGGGGDGDGGEGGVSDSGDE